MLIISRAIQPRPRGLSGWTVLFDWLRRNHVQKIMKVMVIDDGQTSHTDAAIEDALSGFEAELKVIREICLYSSENQAGLMSWSSTEGLRDPKKFPEARPLFFGSSNLQIYAWTDDPLTYFSIPLGKVRLFIPGDQEDETRSREYIDTFKGKLNHAPAKDHGERIDFKYRLDNEAVSSASDFKNNEGAIQLRVHN
ncbi:intracellular serine protease [Botrytis cinerea]